MDKHGTLIDNQTLQFVRILPGPIERVWEYITDAEKRGKWFCGGTTNLEPEGEITFVFNNSQLGSEYHPIPKKYEEYDDGFESQAKVLKVNPHTLFVMEWEGIVTFQLEEQGAQVKLTLTHEKLNESKETRVGTLAGWHTHLDILVEHLQNGQYNGGFWNVHMDWEDHYEKVVE